MVAGLEDIEDSADSARKHLVQLLRIKADHDFIANHNGGRGTAVIGSNQFENGLLILAHVFHFKWNTFLRKVGFGPCAGRSTR